jgi:RNA-binding protein
VTDEVIAEIDRALKAHELIKVRAPGLDREQRDAALVSILERTKAENVQQIGKVFVLYRKNDDDE